jgi:hypothetical protein
MKEELETKLNMVCCNAKERNGTVWFGLEILKLGVIMRGAVKGGCPLRKEEEWGSYYYYFLTSKLIVQTGLDVSTFATRRLHACHHARAPSGGRWNCGREMSGKFCLNSHFHVTFRDLLHAVKLRHGNDGFTSPPKEGVLRIFFVLKIRWLRPGANPRTWVPKASYL